MISSRRCGYHFSVPPASPSPVLGLSLRCDHRAPRLARQALGQALEQALEEAPVLEDARLIASELVNNAVLSSGCAADDIIRVAAQLEDGFLVISVHDPGVAPRLPGGFGLRVLQRLAARWGTESPAGHRVWAALALGAA
jgi:anti-sigma regulatory factor (Ser/Thr protein kinase)